MTPAPDPTVPAPPSYEDWQRANERAETDLDAALTVWRYLAPRVPSVGLILDAYDALLPPSEPAVCPYIVNTDDATSYCSLAESAGPPPSEPGARGLAECEQRDYAEFRGDAEMYDDDGMKAIVAIIDRLAAAPPGPGGLGEEGRRRWHAALDAIDTTWEALHEVVDDAGVIRTEADERLERAIGVIDRFYEAQGWGEHPPPPPCLHDRQTERRGDGRAS